MSMPGADISSRHKFRLGECNVEKVYYRPHVTQAQKRQMNAELSKLAVLHRKKGVMNHWTLCVDCPYPNKGFVCWSRNRECLRTRMMVLDGHGDEVEQISRINGINEVICPFQIILQHSNPENPVFQFMDKKRSEGKHFYVYMVAGGAKFLRIYYARVKEILDAQDALNAMTV